MRMSQNDKAAAPKRSFVEFCLYWRNVFVVFLVLQSVSSALCLALACWLAMCSSALFLLTALGGFRSILLHIMVAVCDIGWHVVAFHPRPWKSSCHAALWLGFKTMMDTFLLALSNILDLSTLDLYGHWCWRRSSGRIHSGLHHRHGHCADAAFHLFDAPRTRACNDDFGFGWRSFWRPYVRHL